MGQRTAAELLAFINDLEGDGCDLTSINVWGWDDGYVVFDGFFPNGETVPHFESEPPPAVKACAAIDDVFDALPPCVRVANAVIASSLDAALLIGVTGMMVDYAKGVRHVPVSEWRLPPDTAPGNVRTCGLELTPSDVRDLVGNKEDGQ